MSLRHTYTYIAPLYDSAVEAATRGMRKNSLQALSAGAGAGAKNILLSGVGTGLDFAHLPDGPRYTAADFNAAMLARALSRASARRPNLQVDFVRGNSMALPFADDSFDAVVLHLIVAVVPCPLACLQESARVLKPGGQVLILDKFLKPGETAWLRRALNPLVRRIATRLDVVFEELLAEVPTLKLQQDSPVLAGGWFRSIRLKKLCK